MRRRKKLAMTLAIGVAAGLLLTVVGIRLFENSFIYAPPRFPKGFPPPQNLMDCRLRMSG